MIGLARGPGEVASQSRLHQAHGAATGHVLRREAQEPEAQQRGGVIFLRVRLKAVRAVMSPARARAPFDFDQQRRPHSQPGEVRAPITAQERLREFILPERLRQSQNDRLAQELVFQITHRVYSL